MYTTEEVVQKVKLGMTRDEVKAVLGEPEAIGRGTRKYPRPCIWKYGHVELHFHYPVHGGLWLVGLFEDPEVHITLMKEEPSHSSNRPPNVRNP